MSRPAGGAWRAWLLPVAALVAWGVAYGLALAPPGGGPAQPAVYLVHGVPYVAFAAVGGLIIRGSPAVRVGWVMGAIGVCEGVGTAAAELMAAMSAHGAHPGAAWLQLVSTPASILGTALIVVLLVVFPDGRLPSPGWRVFAWGFGAFLLAVLVHDLTAPLPADSVPGLPPSPLAAPAVAAALAPFTGFELFPVIVLGAAGSLVLRYRAGNAVTRRQIKWLALSAVVLAVCEAGNVALGDSPLSGVLDAAGKCAVVAAIGIAVLRHRLYDVDRAISRALAYGWLAVLVTGIYVALVVGVGSALGRRQAPDLLLSVAATIVVAVVSLPLHSRLREAANRLVYGRRQAPYESLAGFTRRLGDGAATGDLLARIAAALGEGLQARVAVVVPAAEATSTVWPVDSSVPTTAPTATAAMEYRGEELGRLSVWTDDEPTGAERRLLADLATQAGLVLHNAALSTQLHARLVELRASRLRLVAAQDAERRRFERDLHDGAQQELLTLRMKLGAAGRLAAGTDARVEALLAEVQEATAAALESIRRLSRGLYPPLLQSHGLLAALAAHTRRLPLPVEVHGSEGRYPADVETAVYFCCTEALQNVVKHACASRATVRLDDDGGRLCFEVGDDGAGFPASGAPRGAGLQNMTDRVEALGGRLEVRSGPGGTRIAGSVPLPAGEDRPTASAPHALQEAG